MFCGFSLSRNNHQKEGECSVVWVSRFLAAVGALEVVDVRIEEMQRVQKKEKERDSLEMRERERQVLYEREPLSWQKGRG